MHRKTLVLLLAGLLVVGMAGKVWARHGYSIVDDPRIYEYRNARATKTQPSVIYIKKVVDKRPDYERSAANPHYMYTLDGWWLRGTTFEGQLTEVMTEELRRSGIFREVSNLPQGADYTLDTLVKHCYGKYQRSAASYAPFGGYALNHIFGGTTVLVTLKKGETVVMQKEYSEETQQKVSAQRSAAWMYVMLGDSLERCMERILKDIDSTMGGEGLLFGQAPSPQKEKAKIEQKKEEEKKHKKEKKEEKKRKKEKKKKQKKDKKN
jgi:hypothetical protein